MQDNIKIGKNRIRAVLLSLSILLIINNNCFANEEIKTIAQVIAAESASEGILGMTAVACVIANRARAQGKTPYQIVTAKNQFYGLTAKNRDKLYRSVKSIADSLAARIMSLPDITGGALYFRTAQERVSSWHSVRTVKIGKHIFYK